MRKFKDLPMTTGKSKTYAGIGHRDLGGFCEPNTKLDIAKKNAQQIKNLLKAARR